MQHAVDTCICGFFRFLPNCAQQADWHELSLVVWAGIGHPGAAVRLRSGGTLRMSSLPDLHLQTQWPVSSQAQGN